MFFSHGRVNVQFVVKVTWQGMKGSFSYLQWERDLWEGSGREVGRLRGGEVYWLCLDNLQMGLYVALLL